MVLMMHKIYVILCLELLNLHATIESKAKIRMKELQAYNERGNILLQTILII